MVRAWPPWRHAHPPPSRRGPDRRRHRLGLELSGGQGCRHTRHRLRFSRHQVRPCCDRTGDRPRPATAPVQPLRSRPGSGLRNVPRRDLHPGDVRAHHDLGIQRGTDHLPDHRHDSAACAVGPAHPPSRAVLRSNGRGGARGRAALTKRRVQHTRPRRPADAARRPRPRLPHHRDGTAFPGAAPRPRTRHSRPDRHLSGGVHHRGSPHRTRRRSRRSELVARRLAHHRLPRAGMHGLRLRHPSLGGAPNLTGASQPAARHRAAVGGRVRHTRRRRSGDPHRSHRRGPRPQRNPLGQNTCRVIELRPGSP